MLLSDKRLVPLDYMRIPPRIYHSISHGICKLVQLGELEGPIKHLLRPRDKGVPEMGFLLLEPLVSRLRWLYRRRLNPPLLDVGYTSFADYCELHILGPAVELFNHLRMPRLCSISLEFIVLEDIASVLFSIHCAEKSSGLKPPPAFIFVEPGCLTTSEESPTIAHQLCGIISRASEHLQTPTELFLVSDLNTVFLIKATSPPLVDYPMPMDFERYSCHAYPTCLRLFCAASLWDFLGHINTGYLYSEQGEDEDEYTTQGCINSQPMALDSFDQVLATHHRRSDFDRYTLGEETAYAMQALQWDRYMIKNVPRAPVCVGDIVTVETNGFNKWHCSTGSWYPLVPLPDATLDYMRSIERPFNRQFHEILSQSKSFAVEIVGSIGSGRTSVVYSCRVVRVDSHDTSETSPTLCIKLVDDRFFKLDADEKRIAMWGSCVAEEFVSAEDCVGTEQATYLRLQHAQGSLIPRYYGAHRFTVANSHTLYGHLMELVPGASCKEPGLRAFSNDDKIDFIKSSRHATRVLQSADISQTDWHCAQIMCVPNPPNCTTRFSAVFLDFAVTRRSIGGVASMDGNEHRRVMEILCKDGLGLGADLVQAHYEEMDPWDPCKPEDDTVCGLLGMKSGIPEGSSSAGVYSSGL